MHVINVADVIGMLGKRIVDLQTSLALVHGSSGTPYQPEQDVYGREPFQHPALDGLHGLTGEGKLMVIEKRRMAQLAEKYGLHHVIRWKPKQVRF